MGFRPASYIVYVEHPFMALTMIGPLHRRVEDGWVQPRQAISKMSVVLERKKGIPSVRTCVRAQSAVLVDFICASITGKGVPGEKMALLHVDLGYDCEGK